MGAAVSLSCMGWEVTGCSYVHRTYVLFPVAHGRSWDRSKSAVALEPGEVHTAPRWAPNNSDGTNRGTLPARDGLIFSRNTMTVELAKRLPWRKYMLWQVSPALRPMFRRSRNLSRSIRIHGQRCHRRLQAFAAGGVRREPYLIERIDDQDGTIIYQAIRSSDRSSRRRLPGW